MLRLKAYFIVHNKMKGFKDGMRVTAGITARGMN